MTIVGWLFCEPTLKDLIAHLIKPWESEIATYRWIAKAYKQSNPGNGRLWAVLEITPKDGSQVMRVIYCFLTSYSPRDRDSSFAWGYKDIEETMGPVHKDCPAKFLDLVEGYPDPGMYSSKWREEARAWNKEAAARRSERRARRKAGGGMVVV